MDSATCKEIVSGERKWVEEEVNPVVFALIVNLTYRSNAQRDSATVNWYFLQPILERSPCDVVLIFDCCYAASAARSAPDGTTELLAACGRENLASPVCDYSFTRVLMEEISTFGSNPFTVAQLHTRLIKERAKLRHTPIHAFISDESHPSIRIVPLMLPLSIDGSSSLPESPDTPDSSMVKEKSTFSDNESPLSTAPTTPSKSPSTQEPRVLLAVSLEHSAEPPDVESWSKWLTSGAPQGIRDINVKIEAAFASHSTLLLVSLPVSVWNLFPETSAYRFVDYIRSPDISMRLKLIENLSLIDAKDPAVNDDGPTPRANRKFVWPVASEYREGIREASLKQSNQLRKAGVVVKKAMRKWIDSKKKREATNDAASDCSERSELSVNDHTFSEDGLFDPTITPRSSAIQSAFPSPMHCYE